MKKITILSVAILLFAITANSQITKGNWLVGGNGRFSSQIETLNGAKVNGFLIGLTPNIGYFFIDKFAAGTKISFNYNETKYYGSVSKSTQLGLGPFLRYYFLNKDNRINVFAESEYQYLRSSSNGTHDNQNTFTFSAGPVIYFNSSVGLELTANYEIIKTEKSLSDAKTFFVSVGFQVHLEKEKH